VRLGGCAWLAAFKAARETTAGLLERLAEADWTREGTHPEHGRYGMDTWLGIYAAHAHDHAEQIRRARASRKA
jgi:DinB superfamily